MRIDNPDKEKMKQYIDNLYNYAKSKNNIIETKFIDLGVKIIRVLNYSKDFTPLMQKQLTYTLKDRADRYDATLILWNEKDIISLAKHFVSQDSAAYRHFRIASAMLKAQKRDVDEKFIYDLQIFDESYSKYTPIICFNTCSNIFSAYDKSNETYFYGVENLEPEEFIKEGHIFVQILNKILKSENTNLVHGAVVGVENKGILFCARGQRGKSTLVVLSMMKGFEYVSDDYLTLEKEGDNLYSYPIYSIITLSPRMYNELYNQLEGTRFVSNNARKDKYVINIEKFHNQFKKKYPIKCCILPEIVSDKEPAIFPCSKEDKGRAIVQLIHSTVMQMQDLQNRTTIKKLFEMVKDFTFYKFNLCNDINKNTEFLRNYMQHFDAKKDKTEIASTIEDITFDLANILSTKTYTMYSMNKFATNIYENLKAGVTKEAILNELNKLEEIPKNIDFENQLDLMLHIILEKEFVKELKFDNNKIPFLNTDFAKEDNYEMTITEYTEEKIQNLIYRRKENELCIK